jgi:hypothetical protein
VEAGRLILSLAVAILSCARPLVASYSSGNDLAMKLAQVELARDAGKPELASRVGDLLTSQPGEPALR